MQDDVPYYYFNHKRMLAKEDSEHLGKKLHFGPLIPRTRTTYPISPNSRIFLSTVLRMTDELINLKNGTNFKKKWRKKNNKNKPI